MTYPADFNYAKSHEYAKLDGNKVFVGITNYAQDQLGDIVYVELPEVGRELKAGDIFAAVESVKAVSDCYTPVSGTVIEINEKLLDAPEIINEDPHGQGWICVIEIADEKELDELMDNAAYESFIKEGGN